MNESSKCHLSEAAFHLRQALSHASNQGDESKSLHKLTAILNTIDKWMEESGTVTDTPKKSVLNNTPFKWDTEYSFVPASQNLNDVVHCESLTD